MKKTIFLPFLLMSPLLFIANSPAPYYADFTNVVYSEDYQLSNLTYGAKETMGDLELYPFTLDVQNNSDFYLSYWSLDIQVETSDPYVNGVQAFKILTPYYDEECIKPSETMTVMGYALEQYPLDQLYAGRGYGYSSSGVSAEFNGFTLEGKTIDYPGNQYYKKTCRYDIHLGRVSYEQEDGYVYAAIYEYSLNGHTYYHFERNMPNYFEIYSFEDANQIEIKSVSVIKEPYRTYNYGGDLGTILKGFGIVCLILLGVLLGIGWIVSSIIVLVKQPWRRKNEG